MHSIQGFLIKKGAKNVRTSDYVLHWLRIYVVSLSAFSKTPAS
jgi:hypothetical protein